MKTIKYIRKHLLAVFLISMSIILLVFSFAVLKKASAPESRDYINLLENGGFEEGYYAWADYRGKTAKSMQINSKDYVEGENSLYIKSGGIEQVVELEYKRRYLLSMYYKGEGEILLEKDGEKIKDWKLEAKKKWTKFAKEIYADGTLSGGVMLVVKTSKQISIDAAVIRIIEKKREEGIIPAEEIADLLEENNADCFITEIILTEYGHPRVIKGILSAPISYIAPAKDGFPALDIAAEDFAGFLMDFIDNNNGYLGFDSGDIEITETKRDDMGRCYIWFRYLYKDIPILGLGGVCHFDDFARMSLLMTNFLPINRDNVEAISPVLKSIDAVNTALRDSAGNIDDGELYGDKFIASLCYIGKRTLIERENPFLHLCWRVDSLELLKGTYFVNALTGEIEYISSYEINYYKAIGRTIEYEDTLPGNMKPPPNVNLINFDCGMGSNPNYGDEGINNPFLYYLIDPIRNIYIYEDPNGEFGDNPSPDNAPRHIIGPNEAHPNARGELQSGSFWYDDTNTSWTLEEVGATTLYIAQMMIDLVLLNLGRNGTDDENDKEPKMDIVISRSVARRNGSILSGTYFSAIDKIIALFNHSERTNTFSPKYTIPHEISHRVMDIMHEAEDAGESDVYNIFNEAQADFFRNYLYDFTLGELPLFDYLLDAFSLFHSNWFPELSREPQANPHFNKQIIAIPLSLTACEGVLVDENYNFILQLQNYFRNAHRNLNENVINGLRDYDVIGLGMMKTTQALYNAIGDIFRRSNIGNYGDIKYGLEVSTKNLYGFNAREEEKITEIFQKAFAVTGIADLPPENGRLIRELQVDQWRENIERPGIINVQCEMNNPETYSYHFPYYFSPDIGNPAEITLNVLAPYGKKIIITTTNLSTDSDIRITCANTQGSNNNHFEIPVSRLHFQFPPVGDRYLYVFNIAINPDDVVRAYIINVAFRDTAYLTDNLGGDDVSNELTENNLSGEQLNINNDISEDSRIGVMSSSVDEDIYWFNLAEGYNEIRIEKVIPEGVNPANFEYDLLNTIDAELYLYRDNRLINRIPLAEFNGKYYTDGTIRNNSFGRDMETVVLDMEDFWERALNGEFMPAQSLISASSQQDEIVFQIGITQEGLNTFNKAAVKITNRSENEDRFYRITAESSRFPGINCSISPGIEETASGMGCTIIIELGDISKFIGKHIILRGDINNLVNYNEHVREMSGGEIDSTDFYPRMLDFNPGRDNFPRYLELIDNDRFRIDMRNVRPGITHLVVPVRLLQKPRHNRFPYTAELKIDLFDKRYDEVDMPFFPINVPRQYKEPYYDYQPGLAFGLVSNLFSMTQQELSLYFSRFYPEGENVHDNYFTLGIRYLTFPAHVDGEDWGLECIVEPGSILTFPAIYNMNITEESERRTVFRSMSADFWPVSIKRPEFIQALRGSYADNSPILFRFTVKAYKWRDDFIAPVSYIHSAERTVSFIYTPPGSNLRITRVILRNPEHYSWLTLILDFRNAPLDANGNLAIDWANTPITLPSGRAATDVQLREFIQYFVETGVNLEISIEAENLTPRNRGNVILTDIDYRIAVDDRNNPVARPWRDRYETLTYQITNPFCRMYEGNEDRQWEARGGTGFLLLRLALSEYSQDSGLHQVEYIDGINGCIATIPIEFPLPSEVTIDDNHVCAYVPGS